ncbi:hypothetical protein LPW36_01610 [Jinshanibacter sp. LJY008]|uniref:Flavodoxin-like fold domain-containing protein n=1 Tax=Limnobaculum eriocheiris TaxID=2897391 RepID=A0A9X1MSI7_9GAMM|nr:hypothetical protein [Limnobaculum eriocheiris]MCD1124741.1 hypothetical protein [Limnobaculum eriocheiris]
MSGRKNVPLRIWRPGWFTERPTGVYCLITRWYLQSCEGLTHDFQEPYLVSMLGTLGLKDIHIVRAEGVSMSHPGRDVAMANAMQQIRQIFNLQAIAQPA